MALPSIWKSSPSRLPAHKAFQSGTKKGTVLPRFPFDTALKLTDSVAYQNSQAVVLEVLAQLDANHARHARLYKYI